MLTNQQLKWRKTGIGGSDIAILFGCGFKGSSPLTLWKDKLNYDQDKQISEELQTTFEIGEANEPVVLRNFTRKHFKEVVRQDNKALFNLDEFKERYHLALCRKAYEQDNIVMFRHPNYPFLVANVDGFIKGENAIIECKTISPDYNKEFMSRYDETEHKDNMPENYYLQCMHYALVLGVDKVYFHALCLNKKQYIHREIDCTTDDAKIVQEAIIKKAKAFWENYVMTETPPPPETIKDCRELYPEAEADKLCIATTEMEAQLKRYMALKDSIKAAKAETDQIQAEIVSQMKDAACLLDSGGTKEIATFKNRRLPRQVMMKQLKDTHPDIYDEFTYQNETRVFALKRGLEL